MDHDESVVNGPFCGARVKPVVALDEPRGSTGNALAEVASEVHDRLGKKENGVIPLHAELVGVPLEETPETGDE